MITEDYVSFEVAKLLKEKGFDVFTYSYYSKDDEESEPKLDMENLCSDNWNGVSEEVNDLWFSAPTLQMAMKWLRERGWFIHIDIIREASAWLVDVQDIKNDVAIYPVGKECSSYEEAAEVAIKYCLENLI